MADSLSIQPVVLSRLTGISPVVAQQLTTSSATSISSIFSDTANTVDLSASGLLLSEVSSFRTQLEALQATAVDNSPGAAVSAAQGLVDAVNSLLGDTAGLPTAGIALSDNTLANQLPLTLSQFITASLATDGDTLSSLQSIGIDLQTTLAPTGGPLVALSIDPNQLAAAIGTAPADTQDVLTGAIQSLADQATEIASLAASVPATSTNLAQLGVTAPSQFDLSSLFGLQTNSSAQGIGVATDLLRNLGADTVLNAIQLPGLDLAALGLNADDLQAEDSVIRGALVAALLTPDNPATLTENLLATAGVSTNAPFAGAATPTAARESAAVPGIETPIARAQAPPVTTTAIPAGNPQATISALAADVLAAENRASEATQALQILLADPGLRAIRNQFDPAYSALVAAAHLSDFISPSPVLNPKAILTTDVAPVLPVTMTRAIAYYNETSGAKESISFR